MLCEVYAKLLAMIVLHWVLLVGCWHAVDRSLPKAAQTVQGHALALGAAVAEAPTQVASQLQRIARCLRLPDQHAENAAQHLPITPPVL